jgi:oligoribonuclease
MIGVIDIETTGLDSDRDHILEVAFFIVDDLLSIFHAEIDLQIKHDELVLDTMNEDVYHMHDENGLLDDCRSDDAFLYEEAEKKLVDLYDEHLDEPVPMAGNSVHFDRSFLRRRMPTFHNRFSHRNIDVSSFRLMYKAMVGKDHPFSEGNRDKNHRARDDAMSSFAEMNFYQQHFLRGESQDG